MTNKFRMVGISGIAFFAVAIATNTSRSAESSRCTLSEPPTSMLLYVLRDTIIGPGTLEEGIYPRDVSTGDSSVRVREWSPIPGARVRVLKLDSTTARQLRSAGVVEQNPEVIIRADPYGADCMPIVWTDTAPWAVAGDTGYAKGYLISRERWIGGRPTFSIAQSWKYPYPRERGLIIGDYGQPRRKNPASANAIYELMSLMRVASSTSDNFARETNGDSVRRQAVITWAKASGAQAELEPARTMIRDVVLKSHPINDKLRAILGTYLVTMTDGRTEATWHIRFHDRGPYADPALDAARTSASVVAFPEVSAHRVVAYAAPDIQQLEVGSSIAGASSLVPVELFVVDNPPESRARARDVFPAKLSFRRRIVPESMWGTLDAFTVPLNPLELAFYKGRPEFRRERAEDPIRIPFTIRAGRDGMLSGDTTFAAGGQAFRFHIVQQNTLTLKTR